MLLYITKILYYIIFNRKYFVYVTVNNFLCLLTAIVYRSIYIYKKECPSEEEHPLISLLFVYFFSFQLRLMTSTWYAAASISNSQEL